MNRLHIIFILFAIILFYVIYKIKIAERFENQQFSTTSIQYINQIDHRTMVKVLMGNSGKTVLLIHNNPASLYIWSPLFETIQKYAMQGIKTPTLVAYDVRGHGTAWLPVDKKYNDLSLKNTAWTVEQFVADCKNIYDKIIGSGKVIIVGFGFGGLIAQKFALTYKDLIEKLVILQTSVQPNEAVQLQINYLGGPDGWIAKNPLVYYLTMEDRFAQQMLCSWFYLPFENCDNTLIDEHDVLNEQNTAAYNLAAMMWREGSATTTLQTDKLLIGTNLAYEWSQGGIHFPIHILAATDDPSATPSMMTETFTTIQHANRSLMVIFDVVNGRHGFAVTHPEYIAGIICDNCNRTRDTPGYKSSEKTRVY